MATIVIALLIIGVVAFVAYPLLQSTRARVVELEGASDMVLEGLVSQRDAMYAAIKDLENDHALGKLSDVDYRSLRAKYEAKAVAILQELDHVIGAKPRARPARDDEAIEREIARLRRAKTNSALKCPQCGAVQSPDDVFCARCGASLRGARCPACGNRAAIGDKFCSKCGQAL